MEKVLFFNGAKPDAFQLNESTGLWTDGDSVFCDAIICLKQELGRSCSGLVVYLEHTSHPHERGRWLFLSRKL